MAQKVLPNTELLSIVESIKVPFATGKLKLTKSSITLSKDTVIGDLTAIEADFSGYAAKTLTSLPATYADLARGGYSWQIPTEQWDTANPTTIPNQVFGGWIEDADGNLLFAWMQATPTQMTAPGQSLPLDCIFNWFNNDGINYQSIEVNGNPIS